MEAAEGAARAPRASGLGRRFASGTCVGCALLLGAMGHSAVHRGRALARTPGAAWEGQRPQQSRAAGAAVAASALSQPAGGAPGGAPVGTAGRAAGGSRAPRGAAGSRRGWRYEWHWRRPTTPAGCTDTGGGAGPWTGPSPARASPA
ncbi:unnamed protein product [Prorocentrum cordatum]|uniref:Uncharacterized protein n=1 Tax=Prorocentrum cordatum TaxID=2364126 RepID=A0ABN9VUL7_9DINO|nr:unnamed protein product [Polarella glacialis]